MTVEHLNTPPIVYNEGRLYRCALQADRSPSELLILEQDTHTRA